MKPTLRDYLTIIASLAVIFACGYGIGHRMGAAKGGDSARPAAKPGVSWQDSAAERLVSALQLDDSQLGAVRQELDASSARIEAIRGESRQAYLRELLDLHDRIAPSLNESQLERLEKSRKSLQLLSE
ncbi:hypothetical protein HZ994_07245 [Akkermansiaceae bacterium]|nr:hypothetical protein HZ994_07245 [Akkermansiaceae bacterium]